MPNNNKPGRGSCINGGYHKRFESYEPLTTHDKIENDILIRTVDALRTVICKRCGAVLEDPCNVQQVFKYIIMPGGEAIIPLKNKSI